MIRSNLASDSAVWLQDQSILVPCQVSMIAVVNWFWTYARAASQHSRLSVTFMNIFNPKMGCVALEAPMNQARLWPPAVTGLALVAASRMTDSVASSSTPEIVVALGVVAVVITGSLAAELDFAIGLCLVVVLAVLALVRGVPLQRSWRSHSTCWCPVDSNLQMI
jgi:hypothetical protein